jgi:hypothetical protein
VHRYDPLGELTAKCPISSDVALSESYGQWMRIDDLGSLYVKNSRGTYRICTGVNTSIPLRETNQLQTERPGSPNTAGNRWFRLRKISKQQFHLEVSDLRQSRRLEMCEPLKADDHREPPQGGFYLNMPN